MTIYPWQQSQWQTLLAERKQGRLPHALLLTGQHGLGKLNFARVLAKAVLCEKNSDFACDQCRGCRLFDAGNHPDFLNVEVEEKSKAIKVAQIRELIAKLNQTSQRSGYQIVIINPAETMNRAAANAFLKTLEEPAGQVLLLLISHQTGNLPATVLSRCQRVTFSGSDNAAILDWLKSALPADVNAPLLLKMANHAPLGALQLMEANYLKLRDDLLAHLWKIQQKQVDPIVPIKAILQHDRNLLMQAFVTIILDILRLQLNIDVLYIVNEDRIKPLQELSVLIDRDHLLALLMHLQEAQKLLSTSVSVNVQMMLESLLLQWQLRSLCHAR